jgi:teichuronic acid biosynthesis glycosyltransferase TuaG
MSNSQTAAEPPHDLTRGLVSIIMPAHNSERTMGEAVNSVVTQTYPDWELLIIDDASKDSTRRIASEFASDDPRIRVVPLDKNVGVAEARNIGIRTAKGQYLAFLDSDDLWLPAKLQVQLESMRRADASFSFSRYSRIKVDGSIGRPVRIPASVSYRSLLRGNVIGCLTVVIDRLKIPSVSMPHISHEDYATWLSILKPGGSALGIQQDLARYRLALSSVSSRKSRSASWTWKIYRNVERLSLLESAWCFLNYSIRAIYIRWFH